MATILWKCITCQATLGHVENETVIRVKRKDLYVEIGTVTGCYVTVNCTKCGKPNMLQDLPEEVQNIQS